MSIPVFMIVWAIISNALGLAWALTGLRTQHRHQHTQQGNCEGRGVVGRVHGSVE